MAKTIKVKGVDLRSGFWWIIDSNLERLVLRNRRNQRMILHHKELQRVQLREKRIKLLEA